MLSIIKKFEVGILFDPRDETNVNVVREILKKYNQIYREDSYSARINNLPGTIYHKYYFSCESNEDLNPGMLEEFTNLPFRVTISL